MKQAIDSILQIADRRERYRALLDLLEPGDIVIDCGANIGDVAVRFARRGCILHCFEPDPAAFAMLSEKLASFPDVHLYHKAVWTHAGKANLHFHTNREENLVSATQSSSLMSDKINVDAENSIETELVDLPAFLRELPKPAAVLKVDIEGAEGELLRAILEQGLEDRFQIGLVETHERKVPSSRASMRVVRDTIQQRGIKHIFLDWF